MPQRIEMSLDCFVEDELLDWKLKPSLRKVFTYPDYKMEIISNERGFRDILHTYEKPNNTFRIVGIGDSFLFGYGINHENNVLVCLQDLLNRNNLLFKKIETINLGITLYSIDQYYKVIKYEAYKYSPDLIILFFFTNDWMEKEYNLAVDTKGSVLCGENFSFRSLRSFLLPLRVFLKTHSQLYIFVRGLIKTMLMQARLMGLPEVSIYKKDDKFQERFAHTFRRLDEIKQFCKKEINCAFLLCIIPDKIQVRESFLRVIRKAYRIDDKDYDWLKPQIALKDFCGQKGTVYLDLTRVFTEYEKQGPCYFDIDPHWNERGHLLAAKELFKFIKENKNAIIR